VRLTPPVLVVAGRDFGCCVKCGRMVVSLGAIDLGDTPGRGTGWSLQHRVPANRADMRLSNLIILCGSGTTLCHGWVTTHPEESYEGGWSVRHEGAWDTADIPVLYGQRQVRRAGRFLLDDWGGIRAA